MGFSSRNSRNRDPVLFREAVGVESHRPWEMGQESISSSAAIGADETTYVGANEGKLHAFARMER